MFETTLLISSVFQQVACIRYLLENICWKQWRNSKRLRLWEKKVIVKDGIFNNYFGKEIETRISMDRYFTDCHEDFKKWFTG